MEVAISELPSNVQEIALVLGIRQTLRLAEHPKVAKNKMFYCPSARFLKPSHWLVKFLGNEDAHKLCSEFGGENVCLGRCLEARNKRRAEQIEMLLEEGMSGHDVGKIFNMNKSAVFMARWRLRRSREDGN